jgi:hypothetical protein
VVVVVAAIAIAIVVVLRMRDDDRIVPSRADGDPSTADDDRRTTTASEPTDPRTPVSQAPPDRPELKGPIASPAGEEARPRSFALAATDHLFLAPDARTDQIQPVRTDQGGDRNKPPTLYYLFTGDRFQVIDDETLTTHLTVYEQVDGGPPVPFRLLSAKLMTAAAPARELTKLIYNDAGADGDTAGDLVQSNRFAPGLFGVPLGTHRIEAELEAKGTVGSAELAFFYTPASAVPARFTGEFDERIENGSLVVSAGVDVTRPGSFLIDANLFSAKGEPVARSAFRGDLAKGARTIDLVFLGSLLRAKGAEGTYIVRQLRGFRALPGKSPNRELMPRNAPDHRTRRYTLEQFTDAPWTGG